MNETADAARLSPAVRRAADTILWVAALGLGIGLAYFIVVPGQRTAGVVSVVFWYAIPALVVLLAVWALRSSAERRVAAALLLVSIAASAFAAEAILRAFPSRVAGMSLTTTVADSVCPGEFRRQAGCLIAADRGIPFDRRTTLEVIQDFEAQGIEAWPSIDESHYIDPEGGIEIAGGIVVPLSPGIPEVLTVFCNEAGDWVTYVSDEYGFNNPPGSHRVGDVDVAFIGDSFVQGWCVPFEQTLVGHMGQGGSRVLGVGIEGSGPLTQLGIEREYLKPLRPAIVVWVFYEGNDLRDFSRELANDLLPLYLDPDFQQGLRELRRPLEQALRDQILSLRSEAAATAEAQWERWKSTRRRHRSLGGWIRFTELRARLANLGRNRIPAQPYDPEMFVQVASRLRDDVAGWSGTLLFAYLPTRSRFEDPATANPHRARILEEVRALGIPTVDLLEPLADHPDPLSLYPFRLENHFTAEGYDLLSQVLDESIEELSARPEETQTVIVDTE